MALSDSWLKANTNKPRTKTEEHTDRDGLSIRITPKGKIVFQMRYRINGKQTRLDLGTYPLIGLKAARDENIRLRGLLEQGYDPKNVKLSERVERKSAVTLQESYLRWHESYCVQNKKIHHQILRSFEIYVFPKVGKLVLNDVTLHHWLDILEPLADSKPSIADRILSNAKQFLKWSVRRKLIESNPLSEIHAKEDLQIKKNKMDRVLSNEELRYVWMALEQSRMARKNKIFIKLCLVYACRNGELRLSKKADFDFKRMVWTVPPENHKIGAKTGRPLQRPIIPATQELIEQAIELSNGEYLFNNAGTDRPMGKSSPIALPYNLMQWLRRHQGYEIEHWTMHDLRRTARTNFSSITEPHIAETMLGHSFPGEWKTYDYHGYLEEQAAAYQEWWERLMAIVD